MSDDAPSTPPDRRKSRRRADHARLSDAEAVEAVLDGDRAAFEVLVERHQRRVFGILMRMVRDADAAEELTQDVLCRVYFALPDYKPEYRFSSWISRIASNLGIDHIRRAGRTTSLDADDALGAGSIGEGIVDPERAVRPDERAEDDDLSRSLWRAVACLPPEFRDIVLMRHAEELSYTEIARVTGLSMGTVKSRLARARQRLEAALGDLR